ncbi:MAG: zinc ribbon domain-containing protein, partial [Oscillospiraceae bacterium]|nr:zinc ribbon domain-containing protein [Oscillospiraceae bacterium]
MSKTVTCRECGAAVELPDERTAGFCPECGALISASAADARVSVITPAPAPIHPAPTPPATAVAETVLLSPGEPESPNNPAPTAPAPDESDNAPPDGALFYEPPINASQFIAPPVPAKKRTMKIIAAVAAVFVVAAAAVVFFAVPALAGDAYQRAEANFLASIIPATPVGSGGAKRTDFTIEYTPSAGLGLEELGSLLLRGSVNAFERGVDSEMTVSIAGEREIDVAISTDGRETIMSLPNLTDYYFKIISEDTASPQFDYGDIDEQELTNALSNVLGEYFRLTKDVAEAE